MRRFSFALFLIFFSVQTFGADKLLPGFPIYGQPDGISCGPTSASMVLKYYGFSAGIGPLKTQANTRWFEFGGYKVGMTHPGNLSDAMNVYTRGVGVFSATTQDLKRFVDQGRPTIVLLRSGSTTWHYVVVIGYRNDGQSFTIADPGNGGYTHEMTAANLNGAWQFSHDMEGNYIPDRKCGNCHGSGNIWTKCPTCHGSGKLSGPFGTWTKCTFCSGQGKWSAHCPICGGKGTQTDGYRKVVETAGASGHTAVLIDRSSPNVPGDHFGMVCLWNETHSKIHYSFQWGDGSWKNESVEPGTWRSHTWKYTFVNEDASPDFRINFDSDLTGHNTFKKYVLKRTASAHTDCNHLSARDTFKYRSTDHKSIELYHSN